MSRAAVLCAIGGVLAGLASQPALGADRAADLDAAGSPEIEAIGGAPRPTADARIVRTELPITIDGVLNDAAWETARVIDDFTQANPLEGEAPTYRTEVRMLFDSRTLYIGVFCYDDEPGRVSAREKAPDAGLPAEDSFFIAMDTNGDRRTGYYFQLGAGGAKIDGLIENNEGIGNEWDGLWDGKTNLTDEGWSAEFAIPFATIGFSEDAPLWSFNFARRIGRTNELDRWRNARRNRSTTEVALGGLVEGIEDVDDGHGLTIQPYVLGRRDFKNNDSDAETGLDVYYRLNAETTLAVTINTDFAETEVDDRIVNLTRFPVFFPEQRDFFLQDAGVFRFGGIGRSPLPFFSRRIGIVDGEEQDIRAGVKLTGRQGPLRFGVLNVQMAETEELGRKNLSIGRLAADLGEESNAGFIFTNGDPSDRGQNTLLGVDYNLRRGSFGADGSQRLEASAWAQGTYTDPAGGEANNGDTTAIGGRFELSSPFWRVNAFLARIGRDYDPALGFVQRTGRVEGVLRGSRSWALRDRYLREVKLSGGADVFWLLNGEVDTAEVEIFETELETRNNDDFFVRPFYEYENITEPFEIVDGVVVPVDRYDTGGAEIGFRTNDARPLSVDGSFTARTFYSGTRQDYVIAATLRPGPGFRVSGSYEINDVQLDEGDFTVRLATGRVSWQISPELSLSATGQWDNQSDEFGLNTRLRWEFDPGQELFVVFDEGFDVVDDRFTSSRQDLTVKLGLTLRY